MKLCSVFLFTLFFIAASSQNSSKQSGKTIYLPSKLTDGRFYLKIPTVNGDTILGFCDTGGGYTAIYSSVIKRLNAESKISETEVDGEKIKYILAKEVFNSRDMPTLKIGSYTSNIKLPFFEIPPDDDETAFFLKYVPHDAFLGQFFFINHAWTFDYIRGKVFINTPLSINLRDENVQTLGFKKNKAGKKAFGHASMKILVDEQAIDVLFDTGASFLLSDSGKTAFNNKGSIGGSFIAKSIFDAGISNIRIGGLLKKEKLQGLI
jgi:hypothetical protein